MSTHCRIAIKTRNGKYESIYVHDGRLNKHIELLSKSFSNSKKIQKLIDYGNASYIGKDIDTPTKKDDYENNGKSSFYVRDWRRSEREEGKEVSDNFQELVKATESIASTDYLFVWDGGWKYYTDEDNFTEGTPFGKVKESFDDGILDFESFVNEKKESTILKAEADFKMKLQKAKEKMAETLEMAATLNKKIAPSLKLNITGGTKTYTFMGKKFINTTITLKGKGILHEITDDGEDKGGKYILNTPNGISDKFEDKLIKDEVPNAINHSQFYYPSLSKALEGSIRIAKEFSEQ